MIRKNYLSYALIFFSIIIVITFIATNDKIDYTTIPSKDGKTAHYAYAEDIYPFDLKNMKQETTSLYLYSNHLKDKDLKFLPPLLNHLTLRNDTITGDGFIHLPKSLENLQLYRLKSFDFKNLKNLHLPKLTHLSLQLPKENDNQFLKDIPKSVKSLSIVFSCALNEDGMEAIQPLPLQSLSLEGCYLSPESFKILATLPLKKLSFWKTNISDKILLTLPQSIEELHLIEAPSVSKEGLDHFVKMMPRARKVTLKNRNAKTDYTYKR